MTTIFPRFIPKNAISLKDPKIPQIPRFSSKDVEIPNLGTNSPKVGTLSRGGHGSGVQESTLVGICIFFRIPSQIFVRTQTQIHFFNFRRSRCMCGNFISKKH